jgi:NADH-quinone oxidoreductase subunit N
MSSNDLMALLPELILTATGVVLMVMGALHRQGARRWYSTVALIGLLGATQGLIYGWRFPGLLFGNMVSVDPFGRYFALLFFLIAALIVLASVDYGRREESSAAEYYALLLFATVGMVLVASANELILIFLGLQVSSLSSYVLVGFQGRVRKSSESALKHFLLGSFALAFLLYGIALLFAIAGSTQLAQIREVLHGGEHPVTAQTPHSAWIAESTVRAVQLSWRESGFPAELLGLVIALLFVGLAFKLSAAPFHAWTPDVCQGAGTPIAAFISTGSKAAAFAAFLRIFLYSLPASAEQWSMLLWASAFLTMFVGGLATLREPNLKRLLAFSSIGHTGYMLVAFTAHSTDGVAAILFYLAAYTFMNLGAFVIVGHLAGRGERRMELDDYAGLGVRSPKLAACMAIFLLSLMGIPLTGGFLAKIYVFQAAVRADMFWLMIFGVLTWVIASYGYFRVIAAMYMEPARGDAVERPGAATQSVLALCAAATLLLGIFPRPVMLLAARAARWITTG